jgi:hypothetical protein
MIIDYLNKDQLSQLGIEVNEKHGRVYLGDAKEYEGVTFCNFPTITTDGTDFRNCTFEDTQSIEFSRGSVESCTFRNVSDISGNYSDFMQCVFTQCCSQGPLLTIEGGGCVDGCTFETITALGEDGYVIFSVYHKKKDVQEIKNCRFTDCATESADGALTNCCYFKPLSSYKTVDIDNVDYDSCSFDEDGKKDAQKDIFSAKSFASALFLPHKDKKQNTHGE